VPDFADDAISAAAQVSRSQSAIDGRGEGWSLL